MIRRRARGQAVVEFVLGSLVFITVLLFGIHFAEMGTLSAKVHEASASALWDSTAYRSYQFGNWYNSGAIAAPAAQAAQNRYSDWDGRSSTQTAAPTLVLTRAQPIEITCTRDGAVGYALSPLAPSFGEPGGVSCSAKGDVGVFRLPTAFVDGSDGFFQAPHNPRGANPTTLCSSGRATGSFCTGRLSLLLGDDALTDGSEQQECPLASSSPSGCSNANFYNVTRATWDKSMLLTAGWISGYTGRPEKWASNIVSGVPKGQVTGFYLSFRGDTRPLPQAPGNFREPNIGGTNWQTSPMDAPLPGIPYRLSYNQRRACAAGGYCFLGKFSCN